MARSNEISSNQAKVMSKELLIDLVEDILVRLDGEDLIRCKSVCKSWLSWISSSRFVKNHLDYTCNKDHNNHELGHRRIIKPTEGDERNDGKPLYNDEYYYTCASCIIGSSNGLVCFSISLFNAQVIVTNPLTREVKKLQTPPEIPETPKIPSRTSLCWGFGYDSFTDDYKVVIGIRMRKGGTLFRVLTLKSNIWKVMSQVKYKVFRRIGILWNGMLHWLVEDCYTEKQVILSFNLSRDEFKETSQPHDSRYVCDWSNSLGIAEGCLCIFRNHPSCQRWVMKNNNDKQSWELLPYDCEMNKYDVAHVLKRCTLYNNHYLCDKGDKFLSKDGKYIASPLYVPSLVSPHLNGKSKKKRHTKNNKRSGKAVSSYDVISRFFHFSHDILKRKRRMKNRKINGKIGSKCYVVI
ncbi:putative F-box domain-containing protein [Tanacetum coccineum]